MKKTFLKEIEKSVECGTAVSGETALEVLRSSPDEIPEILCLANRMRVRWVGEEVSHCSIMNAKSGACSEDCAFCAQSLYHDTQAAVSELSSAAEIMESYASALKLPVNRFGLVTSGRALKDRDIESLCEVVKSGRNGRIAWCASFGCLDKARLLDLKEAGFRRFHHNLETAESFFPEICTTHSYALRIDTVRAVREAGMEICCGGILGLGESLEQRVELASILAREQVDSIPLNFLIPIPGTRLENMEVMQPLDMIRSIAMFRFVNPRAEIKISAGRVHLRDLQSLIFFAGATGMMMGELLTVAGRNVAQDVLMLQDLEIVSRV